MLVFAIEAFDYEKNSRTLYFKYPDDVRKFERNFKNREPFLICGKTKSVKFNFDHVRGNDGHYSEYYYTSVGSDLTPDEDLYYVKIFVALPLIQV